MSEIVRRDHLKQYILPWRLTAFSIKGHSQYYDCSRAPPKMEYFSIESLRQKLSWELLKSGAFTPTREFHMDPFICHHCVNVVANKKSTLPFQDKTLRYFFLTSHPCGRPLASHLLNHGFENVIAPMRDQLDNDDIMAIIDTCDVFLLITPSARLHLSPAQFQHTTPFIFNQGCRHNADITFLWYATSLGKTAVHLSIDPLTDWASDSNLVAAALAIQVPTDTSHNALVTALARLLTAHPMQPGSYA